MLKEISRLYGHLKCLHLSVFLHKLVVTILRLVFFVSVGKGRHDFSSSHKVKRHLQHNGHTFLFSGTFTVA